MKNTGLKKFEYATIDNFTSDLGLNIRRIINKPWRSILKYFIKRDVILEEYPKLDKNKSYIFVANHSFDEDVISLLHTIDRNVYVLNGTTDQTEHNPQFIAMWANGMVYVNRQNTESRNSSLDKMQRVIESGNNMLIFSEGGYNNTENRLIMPLFSGAYKLAQRTGAEVVPIITFNEPGSNKIYVRAGNPINVLQYSQYEGMLVVRDHMATILYNIIETHTKELKREELGPDPRQYYMELRKQVYDCQKWYNDVWNEELTMYKGHGVVTEEEVWSFIDELETITPEHASIIAPIIKSREEEKKYNLEDYLRKNIKLQKTK